MSNHIVEEGPHKGHAAGDSDIEKQASQLASDVRYKVKKGMGAATKMSPAQVSRAYLAQLAKSPAPGAVKLIAKKKLIGEAYGSDINNIVKEVISNTIASVFSENFIRTESKKEDVVEELSDDKKYMIVVKDKSTGNTYRRKATRAKIAELRANPNISSVEITHYGKVEDDEAKSGKKTAAAKAGKDYDGDGKIESGAKEYRGAIHNAIQKKKGGKADGQDTSSVKEEFIGEVKESEDDTDKKITGKGVNNYAGKKSAVKLFPSLGEQQENQKVSPEEKKQIEAKNRILQKKMMLQKQAMQMQKQGKLPLNYSEENESNRACVKCGEMHEGSYDSKSKESKDTPDSRRNYTMINLIKNKLRAMGLKMSYEPKDKMIEGMSIDDQMRISREAAKNRKPFDPEARQKQRAAQMRNAAKKAKKDTRTDAERMADATGPRPGSRYRGD
jgi:uncharacterized protein YqgV (UPF0045/DUF77 family)